MTTCKKESKAFYCICWDEADEKGLFEKLEEVDIRTERHYLVKISPKNTCENIIGSLIKDYAHFRNAEPSEPKEKVTP